MYVLHGESVSKLTREEVERDTGASDKSRFVVNDLQGIPADRRVDPSFERSMMYFPE